MRLIELIVGGLIVAGVSAIGIPMSMGVADRAEDTVTVARMQQILSAHQRGTVTEPDAETIRLLEKEAAEVDFTLVADRLSGNAYLLLEDEDGDLWVGDAATGDTTQIGEEILKELDAAGIQKEQVGGPLRVMLDNLDTGTIDEQQIAAILRP